jgi:hypothetical protein
MADREDEFERLLGETGVAGQVDDFDTLASELGVLPQEEAPAAPAREPGTGEDWLDFVLGAEEGLTLGNTRNLGKVGAGIATGVSDVLSPSLERDGMEPEFVGGRGEEDWLSELTDRAQETGAGKLGRGAGTLVTALGTGGAAGAGIGAQAAVGAGLGGVSAAGESDGDWRAILAGMGEGAAFGAAGGALGKAGNAIAQSSDEILRTLRAPRIAQMIRHPVQSALTSLGRGAASSPRTMNALASTARGAGQFAAAGGGSMAGMIGKAQAQDVPDVAYGTAPTMAWAVQSVLTGGGTGLPPADEQRLTEAVISGDMDRLISANFALQQKNPAYAARLQRELEALQEEE